MKVGDVVVATKRLTVWPHGESSNIINLSTHSSEEHNVLYIEKGELLECSAFMKSRYGEQVPVLINVTSHNNFRAQSLQGFELATAHNLDTRQRNAQVLRKNITTVEAEILSLQEKLALATEELHKKREKLESLERFASDDEELAYTLSEVLKVGADEKAILELLKKRTSTDRL